MAKPFTDEHKKDLDGGNSKRFAEGVHKVSIVWAQYGDSDGKDYIDVSVEGSEQEEEKVRLWFHTDGSIKYSLRALTSIFVHNAKDDKKDAARAIVGGATDAEDLATKCMVNLVGREAWLEVKKSERTYTGNDGQVRNSFDKNLYGYEPKPKIGGQGPAPVSDAPHPADTAGGQNGF